MSDNRGTRENSVLSICYIGSSQWWVLSTGGEALDWRSSSSSLEEGLTVQSSQLQPQLYQVLPMISSLSVPQRTKRLGKKLVRPGAKTTHADVSVHMGFVGGCICNQTTTPLDQVILVLYFVCNGIKDESQFKEPMIVWCIANGNSTSEIRPIVNLL